jgi:outer membrane protein assembly factor BamB
MRYVCLLAFIMPVLSAQDGAAIYKERCASCHDAPEGRVPSLAAIKAMSGEAIYLACCTFRGSVVALDAASGKKLWQTFTIPETPKPTRKNAAGKQQYGPSGAGVWSTPTIDEQLGVLYVATETTSRTRRPTPATRSPAWILRPANCCGPSN